MSDDSDDESHYFLEEGIETLFHLLELNGYVFKKRSACPHMNRNITNVAYKQYL